ncbi:MAG: hypothetical protein EBT14_08870, partial [Betaproteobacteria bacterium]|nr:hypothetical protein [Betaproteobacteria bacterium]
WGIFARLVGADGQPLGEAFRVNESTASEQFYPSVTALNDGGFVIAWDSNQNDVPGEGVYVRQYGGDGVALGGETRVNQQDGTHDEPSVAALADGGYVVVWQTFSIDNDGWGVAGQRFDSDGGRVGSVFQANTTTRNSQYNAVAAGLENGGFAVVWSSQPNSDQNIDGQVFDANGVAVGEEFRVNEVASNHQGRPAIVGLAGGGFAVAWEDEGLDNNGTAIGLRFFDELGQAQTDTIQANSYTMNSQWRPAVGALSNGGVQVVWQSSHQWDSPDDFGIYQRGFSASGAPLGGADALVNTIIGDQQYDPSIAVGASGIFVAWSSNAGGSGGDLRGQAFEASKQIVIGDRVLGGLGDDVLVGGAGDQVLFVG